MCEKKIKSSIINKDCHFKNAYNLLHTVVSTLCTLSLLIFTTDIIDEEAEFREDN